jgi:hypothetical protein
MPELYLTIDLSVHNTDFDCEPEGLWPGHLRVPPDFIERKWTPYDFAIFENQQKPMKTLRAKLELSKFVQELCWTVMAVPRRLEEDWDEQDEELAHEILPKHSEVKCVKDGNGGCSSAGMELLHHLRRHRLLLEQESVWRTFQGFVNVAKVDVCWLM